MILKYCMQCAAPLNQQDTTEYVCDNGHQYWNEPKAGTGVVFLRDGKVLLAKRGIDPHKDKYSFPGGFVQFDEEPYDGARREMREETGVEVGELQLLEVKTVQYRENETSLSIIFRALDWQGEFRADDDVSSLVWKPIDFIESEDFAWQYPGLAVKLKMLS